MVIRFRNLLLATTMLAVVPLSGTAFAQSAPPVAGGSSASAGGQPQALTVLRDLPTGADVVFGSVGINQSSPTSLEIAQRSDRAIVNWQSFDIAAGSSVDVAQPGATSAALFRVTGNTDSRIAGSLTANGQLYLINPNGIAIGAGARINTQSFVASTLDIADADFLSGNLTFRRNGEARGIYNGGAITAGADIALLGSSVVNEGVVSARLGRIGYGAGDAITLDFAGDQFLSVAVPVSDAQGLKDVFGRELSALITAGGSSEAQGGRIYISARAARDLMLGAVRIEGSLIATTFREGANGTISLGSIAVDGGDGLVQSEGTINASGGSGLAGGGVIIKRGAVGLGGAINVSGDRGGGSVTIGASRILSLAGTVDATGLRGNGGTINYSSAGSITENTSSTSDASGGLSGGVISAIGAGDVATSGSYLADGLLELGGRIDITGSSVRLLSTQIEARGFKMGGLVRVGGAFQGGAADRVTRADYDRFEGRFGSLPTLANARTTFVNDGVAINVSSARGIGGGAVIWSDQQTTMLGSLLATGLRGGGTAEISGKEELRYVDLTTIDTGLGGNVLLDPSFITIGSFAQASSWQYAAIIIAGAAPGVPGLEASDFFGSSVALNAAGDRLAVGADGDDGFGNVASSSGSVRLFTFTNSSFGGGALAGTIGRGYTGTGNLDLGAALESGDQFGNSVALNATGDRLAVGATGDAGFGNVASLSGAVRLFSFTNSSFGGGALTGTIGRGYTGLGDLDLGAALDGSDQFGSSVALNAAGDRLAVGGVGDAGFGNVAPDAGAVRLFSFTNSSFGGGALAGTIGRGYSGPGDVNLGTTIEANDLFGRSVALNAAGDRLAVGAVGDAGFNNVASSSGAVRLFSFTNSSFGGGALTGTIGRGYSGAGDVDIGTALELNDLFGSSVALNAAGDRLAVGAAFDDGFGNVAGNSGSVRLFSFANSSFGGGALAGTIGRGYTGPGDMDLGTALEESDFFGTSVALNGAGDRLAVGADGDNGFGNAVLNSGAVRFFSFTNGSFGGGALAGTFGVGYTGEGALDLSIGDLEVEDEFGASVALNAAGDRLAVGAEDDDGFGNVLGRSGAVRLFTFTNSSFGGGALVGTIGRGYTGAGNLDLGTALQNNDRFGTSVALNAAGDRLAAGEQGDTGFNNIASSFGAVRLFSFANSSFGGAALVGTIGRGYIGPGDVDLGTVLEPLDQFGSSVALNAAGDRLAVGAVRDDGFNNVALESGAVRLFSFTNNSFGGGALVGTIGLGYTGAGNLDPGTSLASGEFFGISVALNAAGDRLAVGAFGDDGFGNVANLSGAVRLFSFTNSSFGGGALAGTIGRGYTGTGDLDLGTALEAGDSFGFSVALNAAGDRLAVGSDRDGGFGNVAPSSGSVRLFSFTDGNFGGGALTGTIGRGYTGSGDLDLGPALEMGDVFGSSVALNAVGDLLAVGARRDSGFGNGVNRAGAVRLFTSTGIGIGDLLFADNAAGTSNVSVTALQIALSTGQSISFEASNDITLQSALTVNNPAGAGGALSLRAGRSILLNASISADNGNLTLIGNSGGSDLATVNANRLAGAAAITMAPGTSINAGTGAVSISLANGAGLTIPTSGAITLGSISAGSINVSNAGPTTGSNIVLRSGSVLTASGTGRAIDIRAETGTFTNSAGAGAFVLTGGGTYGVFSDAPATTTEGVTGFLKRYNVANAAAFAGLNPGGSIFAYRIAPILTVTANDATRLYGNANPLFTSGITGFIDGDTAAGSLTGAPSLTTLAGLTSNIGNFAITAARGTLASVEGYQFSVVNGTLAVTARPLTVTADALSRIYGNANPALTFTVGATTGMSGLVNGDMLTGGLATAANLTSNVGTFAITQGTLAASTNYALTYNGANLSVTARPLTVTADALTRIYGNANPALTFAVGATTGTSGLVNGDMLSGGLATVADLTSNIGTYAITQGSLAASSNYALAYTGANLSVTPRALTVTADALTRIYGNTNPPLTFTVGGLGLVNGDMLTGGLATAANLASNVGTFAITQGTLAASTNYALTYTGANLSVTPRALTVTADALTRIYGNANPALTFTVGGLGLVNGDMLTGGLATAANLTSNVGTFAITQGSLAASTNYALTYNGANLSVTPRALTVTADALTRIYGNANPALTFAVGATTGTSGLVNGMEANDYEGTVTV